MNLKLLKGWIINYYYLSCVAKSRSQTTRSSTNLFLKCWAPFSRGYCNHSLVISYQLWNKYISKIFSSRQNTFIRNCIERWMSIMICTFQIDIWTILTFSFAADRAVPKTRSVSSTLMKSFGNWMIWYFGSGFGTSSNPRFDSWDKLSKRFMMSTKWVTVLL